MLKATKNTNWNGQSSFDGVIGATFYASVGSDGKISSLSMTPSDYPTYMAHVMEIMNDFQAFQQKIMKDIEDDKEGVLEAYDYHQE